jgi:hypothetical protein
MPRLMLVPSLGHWGGRPDIESGLREGLLPQGQLSRGLRMKRGELVSENRPGTMFRQRHIVHIHH